MDNACIIGMGVVGKATANLFGITKYFSLDESTITLEEAAKCKFVFLCLPTRIDADGNYITSDIEAIIKQMEGYGGAGIYILRSTVWPGYSQNLMNNLGINRIVSNPEFFTEKTAQRDIKNPPFILLGGIQKNFLDDVKGLYESRIKSAPVIVTDNTTAEMAKLAMNGYFITKVVYANFLYDLCQKMNANYEKVKEVLEAHPFGPKNHFTVLHQGGRGAGGRCLRKDGKALAHYSFNNKVFQVIIEANEWLLAEYPKNLPAQAGP